MSRENVELHVRGLDAVNRRDLDALLAVMDPDVEAASALVAIEGGYHGHDGMRRWWENLFAVFPDFTLEVDEVRDFGDVTVAALRNRGHGADSATPFEQPVWHTMRWQRGMCIWWGTFQTRAEALDAVGHRSRNWF
jgi:ketosteroid isomerase-like protein